MLVVIQYLHFTSNIPVQAPFVTMALREEPALRKYHQWSRSNNAYAYLTPRSANTNHRICLDVDSSKIVISRTTLIAALAVCLIITCASVLALIILLYREWVRRHQKHAARSWESSSRSERRLSVARKEIGNHYSQQYTVYHEPENPYMRSNSPVELMNQERLCEAPVTPPQTIEKGKSRHKRSTLVCHVHKQSPT